MSMKHSLWLPCCLILFGLTACGGLFNRTYRYQEEVPLKPFVIKLTKTEYGNVDGKVVLKIFLDVTNKSPDKNNLSRNRFALRVGKIREVARDSTFLEMFGIETVSFKPGETAEVTIPFVLSKDVLEQRLSLIADRREKNGKESLTLIEVKNGSAPGSLPASGEWRITRSSRWE